MPVPATSNAHGENPDRWPIRRSVREEGGSAHSILPTLQIEIVTEIRAAGGVQQALEIPANSCARLRQPHPVLAVPNARAHRFISLEDQIDARQIYRVTRRLGR